MKLDMAGDCDSIVSLGDVKCDAAGGDAFLLQLPGGINSLLAGFSNDDYRDALLT
jgi:hypothetical protein